MFPSTYLVLLSALLVAAHPHPFPRSLPSTWYHQQVHPVHRLFRRASANPGSPQWMAQYPPYQLAPVPEAPTPQSWLAALQAAEQAGKIPNIPVATATGGNPIYPPGNDPNGPTICSSTAKCRGAGDIWDAPDGHVGIGFDDGPADGSAKLYQFLQAQNQSSTHFMIGLNILTGYQLFNQAFSTLQADIAVHTWTHPYMTTWNNTQVLAQLGWTMQIISDLTGGRVPQYWRPPYGDSDNRVRAIAKEVFGLTQVNWNQDSADWSIATGQTTLPKVEASLTGWYAGPKSPGLIILEHELTTNTAQAFINTYPALKAAGWTPVSTLELFDGAWQNAEDNTGAVTSMSIVGAEPGTASSAGASASGTSAAASGSGTSAAAQGSPTANNANNGNKNAAAAVVCRPALWTLPVLVGALAVVLR